MLFSFKSKGKYSDWQIACGCFAGSSHKKETWAKIFQHVPHSFGRLELLEEAGFCNAVNELYGQVFQNDFDWESGRVLTGSKQCGPVFIRPSLERINTILNPKRNQDLASYRQDNSGVCHAYIGTNIDCICAVWLTTLTSFPNPGGPRGWWKMQNRRITPRLPKFNTSHGSLVPMCCFPSRIIDFRGELLPNVG